VSLNRLFTFALVVWSLAVLSALAGRTAFISPGLTALEATGWVFLLGVPVVIAVIIVRGRSAGSIAEVLYDVEHADDTARKVQRTWHPDSRARRD
jgi:hypothetical protein